MMMMRIVARRHESHETNEEVNLTAFVIIVSCSVLIMSTLGALAIYFMT